MSLDFLTTRSRTKGYFEGLIISRSHGKRFRWLNMIIGASVNFSKGEELHKLEAQATLSQREFMRIVNMIIGTSLPFSKGGLEGM